jgi:iron complex outermembrane receptor protein
MRHFKTGNWEQTVLFGYDYQHIGIRETDGFAAAPDINIFHPVYGQTTFPDLFYYLNNNSVRREPSTRRSGPGCSGSMICTSICC